MLTSEGLARFERAIARGRELLGDGALWTVNSTAFGGGVAEMLRSLVGYVRGAGLDMRWVVMQGDPEFFRVTKRLHNRLHGAQDTAPLGPAERATYERCCARNADELTARIRSAGATAILLHDPQTAGMIPRLLELDVPVIWRAHVGLDLPNENGARGVALPVAVRQGPRTPTCSLDPRTRGRAWTQPGLGDPALDRRVLTEEPRHELHERDRRAARGRPRRRPPAPVSRGVRAARRQRPARVTRTARMIEEERAAARHARGRAGVALDRLKDPLGVLAGFAEFVHWKLEDPHLVLAGPDVAAVADDPEGAEVLAEVEAVWHGLPRSLRRRVHLALIPMEDADDNAVIVNALQRRADSWCRRASPRASG